MKRLMTIMAVVAATGLRASDAAGFGFSPDATDDRQRSAWSAQIGAEYAILARMKTILLAIGFLALCSTGVAEEVVALRGDAMKVWTGHVCQCRDVRFEGSVVKGVVTGRDAQLYAKLPTPLKPKGNHVVYLKMKTPRGGRGQLFWIREGDKMASEARQKSFNYVADGAWHTYRIKPGWSGSQAIRQLRVDFPVEFEGGTGFEFAEVVIAKEGALIDVDTKGKIGVAFRLQMPKGVNYCTMHWVTDDEVGNGGQGFTTATDGCPHNYWFDLRSAKVLGWGPHRGWKAWKGRLSQFTVEQTRSERELPVKNLTFLDVKPDTPADPSITSARPAEAIPRAGRPFPVEVIVRNFGTRAAENLVFSFEDLPAGVKVLDTAALTPADPLPGSDGTETINWDCRPPLVCERVYRFVLSDLGEGEKTFGVTLKADGVPAQRVAVEAKVLPSLGLAKEAYPSEPKPVVTAPYEVGAFLFPGWTTHRWHGVWSHAPWRKPVLGWYDEEKPETIDWQIKHMVENGISFVFVDWYWSRGRQHLNHWMKSFKEAKYRKYLKWSLMWANHNGKGSHSVADQEKVTKFWVENYFNDPQYQTIDGMPVVSIWSPKGMEVDMEGQGGCKALLEVSQRVAKEAGYKGIYFVAVRGPDSEEPEFLKTFRDQGFRMTCVYKYMGGIAGAPMGPAGSRPFKWLADTSLNHWRALKKNSVLPFLPSLSTAWDDRPWRGEVGWEITDINPVDYRKICADAKTYSDETGDRLLLMGPLDEWGEGSIGYPNQELGFGMFEAVRDVFGRKPATGWPVNYAPEDVGLVCPQRSLTE